MQFVDTSIYRGPNVYALFPVIRHTVDLGVLEDWPTGASAVTSSMRWSTRCRDWRSTAAPTASPAA
jgi:hypothetical protein